MTRLVRGALIAGVIYALFVEQIEQALDDLLKAVGDHAGRLP